MKSFFATIFVLAGSLLPTSVFAGETPKPVPNQLSGQYTLYPFLEPGTVPHTITWPDFEQQLTSSASPQVKS
jgi:hypothetical protein